MKQQQAYKIVLVGIEFIYYSKGDPKVGKSNLLTRFAYDQFSDQHKITIGVEFASKNVIIKEQQQKLAIWDTCGAEQFRALTKTYYQGAAGALLVFDITDKSSFDNLKRWLDDIESNTQSILTVLVANKIDLADQRVVTKQEAAQFAFQNHMAYFETSAKEGTGVNQVFEQLTIEILKSVETPSAQQQQQDKKQRISLSSTVVKKDDIKENQGCC